MINLAHGSTNENIVIFINLLNPDILFEDDNSYLFGFKNNYTNCWVYVIPEIIVQNTRYTTFGITLTSVTAEDPENGSVAMSPNGNWEYRLWVTSGATLDPSGATLVDKGQAYVSGSNDEMVTVQYDSDNETFTNMVYLTRDESICLKWSTCPDIYDFVVVKWNECN